MLILNTQTLNKIAISDSEQFDYTKNDIILELWSNQRQDFATYSATYSQITGRYHLYIFATGSFASLDETYTDYSIYNTTPRFLIENGKAKINGITSSVVTTTYRATNEVFVYQR